MCGGSRSTACLARTLPVLCARRTVPWVRVALTAHDPALVGFQGLILKCASETLNLGDFLKRIYLFRMVTPG